MKRLFKKITDLLADAALLEMGVSAAALSEKRKAACETLEENLIEAAFAEAADYGDIHEAIMRERGAEQDIVRPDECQYGDNDMCFV